jgi:hypothetical protein
MSAEMALSTSTVEIYIPLLHEGTDVVRPTRGTLLGPDIVQVLATADYDPSMEEWEFPPGSKVQCVSETREGPKLLVARRLLD